MKLLTLQCPAALVHPTFAHTPSTQPKTIHACTQRPCVFRHNAVSNAVSLRYECSAWPKFDCTSHRPLYTRHQHHQRNMIVHASAEDVEIDVEETTVKRGSDHVLQQHG